MSNTGYTWGAENASRGDLDGNGTIEGYVCGYGYSIHIHVQLYEKVEGSYVIVSPSGYWMTDDDVSVKAETGSTSAIPTTATARCSRFYYVILCPRYNTDIQLIIHRIPQPPGLAC